ncbi:hypothetical protein HBB16_03095 [Pseudonocardia sp. MCCB 268]|nr:hypothetical protein [Pseudonocardia cytotoxica]
MTSARPGGSTWRPSSVPSSAARCPDRCRWTTPPSIVFGSSCLNDWSARDIQGFLRPARSVCTWGKSFATSISAWVTPIGELEPRASWLPPHDREPLPYLTPCAPARGLDLTSPSTSTGAGRDPARRPLLGA